MSLFPKEIADRLYQEGKMPEWWYRQHYKTFQENWIDSFNKGREQSRLWREKQAQRQEKKMKEEIEKEIDVNVNVAIEKALSEILRKKN